MDKLYHTKPIMGPVLPSHPAAKPGWVDASVTNLMGLVPASAAHYMAAVKVNNALMFAIVDTGGARTMMDVTVAEKLGLPVERATKGRKFGSFWGPGSKEVYYYGKVRGPVRIQVSEAVSYTINKIKVL